MTNTGETNKAHIVVTTLSSLEKSLTDHQKVIDLKSLRCLVIDEVDLFFESEHNYHKLNDLNNKFFSKLPKF